MRISDWSSDVCSSDLAVVVLRLVLVAQGGGVAVAGVRGGDHGLADVPGAVAAGQFEFGQREQRARAGAPLVRARGVGNRKVDVTGKSVAVRVRLGGLLFFQKKKFD